MVLLRYELENPVLHADGLKTLKTVSFKPLSLAYKLYQYELMQINAKVQTIFEGLAKKEQEQEAALQEQLAKLSEAEQKAYRQELKKKQAELEARQKEVEAERKKNGLPTISEEEAKRNALAQLYYTLLKNCDDTLVLSKLEDIFFKVLDFQSEVKEVERHIILFNDGELRFDRFDSDAFQYGLTTEDFLKILACFLSRAV